MKIPKILIIEDEYLIQKSLQMLLTKKGASVDATPSGKEAIELIRANNYDRIVCDLMLQDITGLDVIEESKKRYSLETIKRLFIIITAYNSNSVFEKASEYGCPVIKKPFEDLAHTLKMILNFESENQCLENPHIQ